MKTVEQAIQDRILVLDGAMGTMLQAYAFTEEDFRGDRFQDFHIPLKGNNDLLSITQPKAIAEVHRKYLEAGADIIETNTFSSTTIAMADYELEDWVYELNYASAKIAKEEAIAFTLKIRISQDLWLEVLDLPTKQPACLQMSMIPDLEQSLLMNCGLPTNNKWRLY